MNDITMAKVISQFVWIIRSALTLTGEFRAEMTVGKHPHGCVRRVCMQGFVNIDAVFRKIISEEERSLIYRFRARRRMTFIHLGNKQILVRWRSNLCHHHHLDGRLGVDDDG
ncbi:10730_t:CDS:2 [Acaulospora morrowiae]|uniref:10730_t:CDS:1 n=1 Tax=Acaulospora morrowiae TaxID=94023 RepID=A0A9N8ZLC5_9GLOM|nr:10730_t:CDS:2 [Acaulospora morrowiae]